MIMINVFLKVAPQKRAAFLTFAKELVTASRQDEGALFYDCLESVETENEFMIIEHWRDQRSVDQHNETPHLKKFVQEANTYLTEDFVIKVGQSTD